MNPAARHSPWIVIFIPYAFGYFFSYLLRNVNAVIAPAFVADLNLSSGELGLLTAAYLVGFAVMQLPVGIALDRFGPRKVEAALLLLAALGCALFALGRNLTHLVIARALIGVGVSACLMAGFKAFSARFPATQRASVNAAIMAAGGLGALTATTPLTMALTHVTWRDIFLVLAACSVVAAGVIARTDRQADTPEPLAGSSSFRAQLGELSGIFTTPAFWRFAPITGTMVGGFIAIQGLWSAVWLADVGQLDPDAVSYALILLNVGLMIGYTSIAAVLTYLQKRGIKLIQLLTYGTACVIASQAAIVFRMVTAAEFWFVYGFFSAVMNIAYTSHASHYPNALSGRANTCLNLTIFICGFLLQWGIGAVVDQGSASGLGTAQSLTKAWGMLIAAQVICFAWFVLRAPRQGAESLAYR